jgi:glycosyltransferase involved in cell wall biosynthesis
MLIADFDKFGGTRTYLMLLLDFYAKQNIQVSVVVKEVHSDVEIKNYVKDIGFDYYVCKNFNQIGKSPQILKRIIFNIGPLWRLFIKIKPDLIIVSTGASATSHINLLTSIILPAKYLYIAHSYPWQPLDTDTIICLRTALSEAKRIVTVSNFAKGRILSYWQLEDKSKYIDVVYNSLPDNSGINAAIKQSLAIKDKISILTLGHTVDYKNPELWIDVAYEVISKNPGKQIEFIWAGDGELLEHCRKRTKEMGVNNIHFIGYQKDVNSLYIKSDIYFQPSLAENLSLAVLQAMSYGLPCVVTKVGGLPEIVVDGTTGYIIETSSVAQMILKFSALIANHTLRKTMGEAGRMRFVNSFQYNVWEEKMSLLHKFR